MKLLDSDQAYRSFGTFIRAGRERRNYTQAEMAEILGISPSHYAYFESGSRRATLPMALNICSVLGLDINDFIAISARRKARVIGKDE